MTEKVLAPLLTTAPAMRPRLGRISGAIANWLFGPIRFPEDGAERIRALARQGTVVYVMRSATWAHFLYFNYAFLKLGLPLARAVHGLYSRIWLPLSRLGKSAPEEHPVAAAARQGESALVCLLRPRETRAAREEKDDPFPALVALARRAARPLFLVPQILVWDRRPGTYRPRLLDVLFGRPDAPGQLRAFFALLRNRRRAFVKIGKPIELSSAIAAEPDLSDALWARKVRGVVSQSLAREIRVAVGPRLKPWMRMIEETLRDRALRGVLETVATDSRRPLAEVEREAEKDLKEIAAHYTPAYVQAASVLLRPVMTRLYEGVDLDREGLRKVERAAARAPVVLCPSHKSHMDYLLLSLLFWEEGLTPPHVAAGANLSFFPLGSFFRRAGAYFLRRSFKGDRVYAAVFRAYVKKLLREGFTQEFFIEGGRSRTGKLLSPKYGMLSFEVDAWVEGAQPDVYFVPVSIAYEKIVEAGAYVEELSGGEKKKEDIAGLLQAPKVLRSSYGRVAVRFDEPISLAEVFRERRCDPANHAEEQRRALVQWLGHRIVDGIQRVTQVGPVGLVAAVLLSHQRRGLRAGEVGDRVAFLVELARERGAPLSAGMLGAPLPGHEREAMRAALDPQAAGPVREAISRFHEDQTIVAHATDGETIYAVPDEKRAVLEYHKNAILHVYAAPALLASSLLSLGHVAAGYAEVRARTQWLSRLFKFEFIYRTGAYFESIFGETAGELSRLGLLAREGDTLRVAEGARERLEVLAGLLTNFVESYWIAAQTLTLLRAGKLELKELQRRALGRARAAFLAGTISRAEAASKANIENALLFCEDVNVIERVEGKKTLVQLTDLWSSPGWLEELGQEIQRYLG